MGYGTTLAYIEQGLTAFSHMYDDVVFWPTNDEKKEIANCFYINYDLPHCIGIIDGTLFPLQVKPTFQGEKFFTHKGGYANHSLIICDDQCRIRGMTVRFPGSVHDNRVWTCSKYFLNQATYFNHSEYLIGDSTFKPSGMMVPSFKKTLWWHS